jgi:hypothetical protein
MPYTTPPEIWDLIITFVLSITSGAISIARRIVSGHTSGWLWIISEFLTAILCGYLMYTAFPTLQEYLHDTITLPVAVALAAHSGGRIFQESEGIIIRYIEKLIASK